MVLEKVVRQNSVNIMVPTWGGKWAEKHRAGYLRGSKIRWAEGTKATAAGWV